MDKADDSSYIAEDTPVDMNQIKDLMGPLPEENTEAHSSTEEVMDAEGRAIRPAGAESLADGVKGSGRAPTLAKKSIRGRLASLFHHKS